MSVSSIRLLPNIIIIIIIIIKSQSTDKHLRIYYTVVHKKVQLVFLQ